MCIRDSVCVCVCVRGRVQLQVLAAVQNTFNIFNSISEISQRAKIIEQANCLVYETFNNWWHCQLYDNYSTKHSTSVLPFFTKTISILANKTYSTRQESMNRELRCSELNSCRPSLKMFNCSLTDETSPVRACSERLPHITDRNQCTTTFTNPNHTPVVPLLFVCDGTRW